MTDELPAVFVLDANVFIEAHRRYYALDLCPGFWVCLTHYCLETRLFSIDRVRREIDEGDTLSHWVKGAPDELFVSSAEALVVDTFADIMAWVRGNVQFLPEATAEFATDADGWLAAYAKVHGAVLVTQEVYNADVTRKVPLPNVCHQFGVATQDTFSMLRKLEVRFSWLRS